MSSGVAAFIEPAHDMLREQRLSVLAREHAPAGTDQKNFVQCEAVLRFCASLVMDYSRYGSASASRAPFPVQDLARVFNVHPRRSSQRWRIFTGLDHMAVSTTLRWPSGSEISIC